MFDGEVRNDNKDIIGSSCEDKAYLKWVQELQKKGFEIALHSSSWSRMKRERIIDSLDLFKKHFGSDPKLLAQHSDTKQNGSIYWGANRLSGINKIFYRIVCKIMGKDINIFHGDTLGSPYFWGDICKKRIKYVRNFISPNINTLKDAKNLPYHDSKRPYVNYWFSSTDGGDIHSFNECLSEENQKKLEEEGGACIIYTHFGKGFVVDGQLNPEFKKLIRMLSVRNGWFVPASELLDHLLDKNENLSISYSDRSRLERNWLKYKFRVGGTS